MHKGYRNRSRLSNLAHELLIVQSADAALRLLHSNINAMVVLIMRLYYYMTVIPGSSTFDVTHDTFLAPPTKPQQTHPHFRGGTSVNMKQLGGELLGCG